MTFKDLIAQVQTVKIEESRAQTEAYFEAVISKATLEPLGKILTDYFGTPLKPEGHSPSGEANRRAEPYGGIRKDQTMYFRQDAEHAECALLWPWGSGTRITVKISQAKSSGSGGSLASLLKNIFPHKS
jgi:hypothetical protein